ncbi:MAG: DegV family protein [Chloroflexota bacterium]
MVKIVTDSTSDIPAEVAQKLGITVVPLNVHFGAESYKDGVDLSRDKFYHRLQGSRILPRTSAPAPGIFADTFDRLAEKGNEIVGIFISHKFSATFEAALQGAKQMRNKCKVEIVDSTLAAMGEGLLVMEVARDALAGTSLDKLKHTIQQTIPKLYLRATLGTLKYLALGGRIGRAQALLGSVLKINPILGIKDGEAFPVAKLRTRFKAIEWLYRFATEFTSVKALAIEHGTNVTEAKALAVRLTAKFPQVPIHITTVNPVIGTHTGPDVLIVSVLSDQD